MLAMFAGDLPHSSPRLAMSAMRSPIRQASAWMVSDGLTPPLVGNSDPSQTHRFGIDQLRPSLFDDAVLGIVAHPAAAHQVRGVVVDPQLLAARGFAAPRASSRSNARISFRSLSRVGEGHARDRQAVLVLLVGDLDPVVPLRLGLADDPQPGDMVVAGHLLRAAPFPTGRG